MTAHDTAGFTIAFAHMNFQDNPDWEKAFDNAQNGDLNITSCPEYDFGDYNVKAPAQGVVYVVTPEVGYVVSDINHTLRGHKLLLQIVKKALHNLYIFVLQLKKQHIAHVKKMYKILVKR